MHLGVSSVISSTCHILSSWETNPVILACDNHGEGTQVIQTRSLCLQIVQLQHLTLSKHWLDLRSEEAHPNPKLCSLTRVPTLQGHVLPVAGDPVTAAQRKVSLELGQLTGASQGLQVHCLQPIPICSPIHHKMATLSQNIFLCFQYKPIKSNRSVGKIVTSQDPYSNTETCNALCYLLTCWLTEISPNIQQRFSEIFFGGEINIFPLLIF